ncbi:12321_t:CDS:1, partial [Dentiscutata erythropus]
PEKLRKHYKSKKNQYNIPITQTQVSKQVLPLTSKSGSNSATQIFSSQNEVQKGVKDQVVVQDLEAGPGPATQTYREEQTIIQEVKYAPENHFRSIYEVEDRIIEKELPTKNIEFL